MFIPADVPKYEKETFAQNMQAITKESEHLFLFAGDQKIEHLNNDFHGEGISADAAHPTHLFEIANKANIGAFATQLGMIARYGAAYPNINYIAKLDSKTNIIKQRSIIKNVWWSYQRAITRRLHAVDPLSTQLWYVDDVVQFKEQSGLHIRGIGYTIYLGSEHEALMLEQAAQAIWQAHQQGLLAILWVYPRGYFVKDEATVPLCAGAVGVANALGADIVKIKAPNADNAQQLSIIKQAAGNTKVIIAGGKKIDTAQYMRNIEHLMHNGIDGVAVGRNIFQQNQPDAIATANQIATLVYTS